MEDDPRPRDPVRFGPFEWNPARAEVRRDGAPLKLSGQPLDVLTMLLANADRLVTREELRKRLWGERTFIDFEQGLNTAIARLRQALGDSAEQPRYIATIPGRGYRFIAPISRLETKAGLPPSDEPRVNRRTWIAGGLGLALGAVGTYLTVARIEAPRARTSLRRFVVSGPPGPPLQLSGGFQDVAISPDGGRVVYRASAGGTTRLYTRALDESEGRLLPGADVYSPFFSPDGTEVGFYHFPEKALMRASVLGGEASRIAGSLDFAAGASWTADGRIIFATSDPEQGLMRVSASGGVPEALTHPEPGVNHILPDVLPGGQAVLFAILTVASSRGPTHTGVLDLRTGEIHVLASGSHPRYAATGHLLYVLENNLMAMRFDAGRLEVRGAPTEVVRGIETSTRGFARVGQYSVSGDGSLLVVMGARAEERRLVWVNRDGTEGDFPAPPRAYTYPRVSPDGEQIALNADGDIEIWNVGREDSVPFASGPSMSLYPVWSMDGRRIVYTSGLPLQRGLYVKDLGSGEEGALIDEGNVLRAPYFFSPSGNALVFAQQSPDGVSLRLMVLDADGSSVELVHGARNADLSPDGSRIAYQSDESGRFEVYVRSFPNVESSYTKASIDGGVQPVWSPAGGELFYIEPGPPSRMMGVSIAEGSGLALSRPRPLFEWPYYMGELGRTYDVSRPEGRRFLAVKTQSGAGGEGAPRRPTAELVLDWFEELNARVPRA